MDLHYLMYKHVRKQTPYQKYIKEKKEMQKKKERTKFFQEILKFNESRYPQELMKQLNREINPFELSIDKLKEVYNSKFPQYSNELVHQAVEYVFKRKCQQSQTIHESAMIIQDGDQTIRNGRKLQKQQFSYFFKGLEEKRADPSTSKDITTEMSKERDVQQSPNSKLYQDIQLKTERFNRMLMDAINNEKNKFQNIQLIEEGNHKDSLFYKEPTSRRDLTDSFPHFKETDLVKVEGGMETGRSQVEELNHLLGGLTRRDQDELGIPTDRSRGSSFTVKINKEVMDNLFNARGKLKLDLVKRVVQKFKRDRQ